LPEPEPDPDRNSYHYCGTARMGSKIYVGDSRKRWEWRLTEADDRSRLNDPAVAWDMVSQWLKPGEARLERTAVYTFHSTIARRWRRGRLMIGGDAAHQTPPFMGQGMVAGLRDAANLGWKLVMVVQGRAPEALLDTYQSERSPHVREYIDLTINLGRLINQTRDRVVGQTVEQTDTGRQTMSKIRPRLGPGLDMGNAGDKDGADPASAGAMFPQFDLADGSRLDDLLSYRSGLILARGADLPDALAARFEAAGIVIHRADSSDLDDWLDRAGAAAVLVRPDRYIGGLAEGRADPKGVFVFRWEDPAMVVNRNATVSPRSDGRIPVVYRVDMRDPATYFAMQNFAIHDRDVLYVSTNPVAEFQRVIGLIASTALPIVAIDNAITR